MALRVPGWIGRRLVIAQNPWLVKISAGVMAVTVVLLMMHRHTREREAKAAFEADCQTRAMSEDECDDLLDRNHTRCFAMSFTGGSRTGTPEHLDLPRYLECVRISPEAWAVERRALLREQERARREEGDPLR